MDIITCKKYSPDFEQSQKLTHLTERAEIWNITVPRGLVLSL